MKAHRWYSAFRNVGIWTLCVVAVRVAMSHLVDYPERHSAELWVAGIGLVTLPLAFLAGVIFPFRSEAAISSRQTSFGWLFGALFGTLVALHTVFVWGYEVICPYVPDEQLFAYAQESVDRVSDQTALEAEIGQALADTDNERWRLDVCGNDDGARRKYPELTRFFAHLHRRLHRSGLVVSAWREDDPSIGPLLVVRYGSHSNYVWIWFHRRWERPMDISTGAREVSPNIVFSSSGSHPWHEGKIPSAMNKR